MAKAMLYPGTRYNDVAAAIGWLKRAFGFEEQFVVRRDDGSIGHAQLRLGDGIFMLGPMMDDNLNLKSPLELGAVTQGVYVALDDVEAHYARARAAGAEIVNELADMPYGSREYSARDLEGHLWSFGTYRPGLEG